MALGSPNWGRVYPAADDMSRSVLQATQRAVF